jgi:hypothetical protein
VEAEMTFEEWRNSLPTPFGKLEAETVWQAKEAIERERANGLLDALQAILKTGDKLSKVVAQYAIDRYEEGNNES